ncbi:MAG: hypothetical protein K8F25_04970, partial [Fimbriimonadaceae bacterium]|nr:hypothetical protein [Alphaproteobacteria bacterium]
CSNLPDLKRLHHVQPDVGHYGVFNGSRFRRDIVPMITDFIRTHAPETGRKAKKKSTPQKRK